MCVCVLDSEKKRESTRCFSINKTYCQPRPRAIRVVSACDNMSYFTSITPVLTDFNHDVLVQFSTYAQGKAFSDTYIKN